MILDYAMTSLIWHQSYKQSNFIINKLDFINSKNFYALKNSIMKVKANFLSDELYDVYRYEFIYSVRSTIF